MDRFEHSTPESGIGWKHLDGSEAFFADHFPGMPLLPAVLLIECAAQAAGVLLDSTWRSNFDFGERALLRRIVGDLLFDVG